MGTRHLIVVVHEGKYLLAQYGQWDGYPEGQGVDVLKFCTEHLNSSEKIENFIQKINKTYNPTETEFLEMWKEFGVDLKRSGGFVEFAIAQKFNKKYPSLSRDTGSEILYLILYSEKNLPVKHSIDFALDSLFCEWAYVIDLDNMKLEVYKGFNKTELSESDRFFKLEKEENEKLSVKEFVKKEYNAIKIIAEYSLNLLPSKEFFLEDLSSTNEDS